MMKVLLTELKRAFFSPGFLAAIAGAVVAGFLGGYEFMKIALGGLAMEAVGEISVQVTYTSMYSNLFVLVIPILCTLPGAASFMEDTDSRFIREYLPRAGRMKYLISKTTATALSGGASVFGGLMAMLLIFSIMFPPLGIEQTGMLSNDYTITYYNFFRCSLLVLLNGCLWSLVGGVTAAATLNKYMAYACPFILYYVISIFQERYFKTYWIFNPKEWIMPGHIELLQAFLCSAAAIAVLSIIYCLLMKRRLCDV